MYEARQYKEKVSRRIDGAGIAMQREKKSYIPLHKKVLQCKILQDEDGLFYSSKDPDKKFDNRAEAEAYECFLSQNKNGRPPTLYTYTHTKETRKVNPLGIPQGPHTLGYTAIENALDFAMQNQNPQTLLNEQCPSPEEWKSKVERRPINTNLWPRINKAQEMYKFLWNEAHESLEKNDMQQFRSCVSSMMQLDPRATYGWETSQKASHAALKGKGENRDIEDDRNVDNRGLERGNFDSEDYLYDRRQLKDGDYHEEEYEEDEYGNDEYEDEND